MWRELWLCDPGEWSGPQCDDPANGMPGPKGGPEGKWVYGYNVG
jgi:hypothetical protein